MSKPVLYGSEGCGSAVVEAALELLKVSYEYRRASSWEPGAALEQLRAVNPLVQVPTFVDEDGTVLTESAAILLHLIERHDRDNLLAPPVRKRGTLYRWLLWASNNIYAPIGISDFPERWIDGAAAREALVEGVRERLKAHWQFAESQLTPAPYLLGERMSVLDIYFAMLTRWRPGREWFASACPKLARAVTLAEANPTVAKVWARNFG